MAMQTFTGIILCLMKKLRESIDAAFSTSLFEN